MDWDLVIKHNSEALKGIIETLFAMLGREGHGFADPCAPAPGRGPGAAAGGIGAAPADRHRRPRCGGEARPNPSHA